MKLIKLNNDAKNRVKRALPPDMSTIPDEDLDFYEEIQYEGKKARGNANSHNKRYKELSKHDFFQ